MSFCYPLRETVVKIKKERVGKKRSFFRKPINMTGMAELTNLAQTARSVGGIARKPRRSLFNRSHRFG